MCKIFIISLLSLFINSFATAQSVVPSVIMGRDTVPHVLLHEVDVVARLKNPRKYARQQQRNQRMVYNVRKVFPYAKIAAAKINEIENKLAQTDSEAKRKQIIKKEYKELMHTFKHRCETDRHARENSRSPDLPRDKQHVVQSHQGVQGYGECLFLAIAGLVVRE